MLLKIFEADSSIQSKKKSVGSLKQLVYSLEFPEERDTSFYLTPYIKIQRSESAGQRTGHMFADLEVYLYRFFLSRIQ